MMSLMHTQVPWWAAIPASAFLLRATLVLSVGTWARALLARYMGLQPLRQALAWQRRDEVFSEMHAQRSVRTPKEATQRAAAEVKKAVAELDGRWNVTVRGQLGWSLIQIPIFFTMAEVIRKMTGARDGLLALTVSAFTQVDATPDALALATSPFFEPTLATEGILWFPNLILPDPFLPFIVSALMFSNIYFSRNAAAATGKNWPTALRRLLLGVSLLIGPLCQNLPSGLMLYWAGSTSSVMLWNKWLDWKYPAPTDFTACSRPLQMPPALKTKPAARRF
ncbi:membrane insertase OXA1/ALB3/YidC [Boeremia exigua]|uniref:membrane insertase OXA1/ALB3/YidC n=1 Tax=Boeremia exigua TaxID=749465 RepID=UPI001E8CC00E|nr:membrane insertase OXA1/ALB3/YidC [Boeremia exigua]KAH6639751.1 membrane insertase OXA1/ALB3/YidC [Boeremia exigua]